MTRAWAAGDPESIPVSGANPTQKCGEIAPSPSERVRSRNSDLSALVVSDTLLAELEDVLLRPRFANRVDERDAGAYAAGIRRAALVFEDPPAGPGLTPDPDDDYLVALARAARADVIVAGDARLTGLANAKPPVLTPRVFADMLDSPMQSSRGVASCRLPGTVRAISPTAGSADGGDLVIEWREVRP